MAMVMVSRMYNDHAVTRSTGYRFLSAVGASQRLTRVIDGMACLDIGTTIYIGTVCSLNQKWMI